MCNGGSVIPGRRVIKGVVEAAKAENRTVITPALMDKVQDKRSSDK
jgi:hypothetical protein